MPIIVLRVINISYSGQSIGDDIRIEITALGKTTAVDLKLKKGASAKLNQQIGIIEIASKIKKIPFRVNVVERDVLFSDRGTSTKLVTIDPSASFPQTSTSTIEVSEFRGFATRSKAFFEILFEASTSNKRIPTVSEPLWTGKFRDDSDGMLLARLIFGEAEDQLREAKIVIGGSVLNRVRAKAWPDTVYDVILQKGQYDPFKKQDRNFKKIIDPLARASQGRKRAWKESYEVAHGLLSESIPNPSTATHFHGRGVSREWFLSHVVPKGKFLKKIGDTFFYWSPN